MASSSNIKAGGAYIELVVYGDKMVKGLKAASAKLKAFGAELTAIGTKTLAVSGAVIGGLLGATMSYAAMGDALDKMSGRTGVAVEALSELGYAAKLGGAELSDVEGGLKAMSNVLYMAGRGSKKAVDALAKVGLTFDDLKGKAPDKQFEIIAERLNAIEDDSLKSALAMKLFGGTNLLPMLNNLAAVRKEARDMGVVMSTEDAKAAAEFTDAVTRLKASLGSVFVTIGSALAPTLKDLAGQVMNTILGFRQWLADNRGLILTILKIAAVVAAASIAIIVLGTVLSGLGAIIGFVGSVLGAVIGLISFILSPIGLVIVAILALGAAFLWICGIGELFWGLLDTVKEVMGGIFNAIRAGDLGLAAEIAWAGLKVAWLKGTQWVTRLWFRFWDGIRAIGAAVWYGLQVGFSEGWYGIKIAFAESVTFIRKLFTDLKKIAEIIWNAIFGTIMNAIATVWNAIADLINGAPKWLRDLAGVGEIGRMSYEDIGANKAEIEARANAEKAAIDAENKATKDQARAEADARQKEIDEGLVNTVKDIDEKKAAREKAMDDELAAAQKELADKTAKANALAEEASKKKEKEGTKSPEFDPNKFAGKFAGIGAGMDAQAAKISVSGTFSAAAADRMGAGGAAERTAKATEKTARWTEKIAEGIDDLELATFVE